MNKAAGCSCLKVNLEVLIKDPSQIKIHRLIKTQKLKENIINSSRWYSIKTFKK